MKRYVTYSLVSMVSALALTSVGNAQERDELRYSECLDLAVQAPDKAINKALIWQNEAGGVPARHCEAVGLFYMREYEEAAVRLERIAEDMRVGKDMPVRLGKRLVATSPMLADMYGQAANAWLLSGEIIRAETAIDIALSLAQSNTTQELDLVLDRARIAAADQDYAAALSDLEKIQEKDPQRADILILIASSARGTGDYVKALTAIDEYQSAYADDPAGYLERGNLLDAMGQKKEARLQWLKVVQLEEDGPNAQAARANIERLDVSKSRENAK